MGIINWLYKQDTTIVNGEKSAQAPGPGDDYWYQSLSPVSGSGVMVTPDTAMQASAVQASVKVLSETIAQLPLKVFERIGDDNEPAINHPLYDLLHDQPNSWQTTFEWREMMMAHQLLRGNAYSLIVPGPRGFADQLLPLHPDRVHVEQLPNKRLVYQFHDSDGRQRKVTQDEMLHFRGMSFDGVVGVSAITWARESIGLAIATEAYGSRFFANSARPDGVLTHPGVLDKEARANLKASWQSSHSGVNSQTTAVLEEGMKWEQMGMTSEDAQFLETRQYQTGDIARIFRVPPHMIGDLAKATFSNIEQQSLEFVIFTMMPHATRWEKAFRRDLLLNPQRFFIQFNFNGLLRGDTKTRYDAYNSAITTGWLTRNEARRLENMNPLPGLDEPLEQMNMAPAGTQGNENPATAVKKILLKSGVEIDEDSYQELYDYCNKLVSTNGNGGGENGH